MKKFKDYIIFLLSGTILGLIIGIKIDNDDTYNIKAKNRRGNQTIKDFEINAKKGKLREGIFKRLKNK